MNRMMRRVMEGALIGACLGLAALIWADAKLPSTTTRVTTTVPNAKPFLGPERGNADPVGNVGDQWLGVHASVAPPIKVGDSALPSMTGSGTSAARGGPGAPWGPVHQESTSAKVSGIAPDSHLFAITPNPVLAGENDRRLKRSDSPGPPLDSLIPPGPPRTWRWDIGY
jgi:hypothetical protein